jgi:hypothetical protein
MGYLLFADIIVILHFLIVVYALAGEAAIIAGYFMRWGFVRGPIFRISHLALIVFVALQAVFGMFCPLTEWEYRLRQLAGQNVEEQISFVARIVRMIIFYNLPAWVFTIAYILFGVIVLLTFIFVPPGFKRREGKA